MKIADAESLFMEFETERPTADGGTHIGFFLGWAIRRGLANAELTTFRPALESGSTTGRDVLFDRCDGKLFASDLGEEGAAFAIAYFEARYLTDYCRALQIEGQTADDLAAPENSPANQRIVDGFLDPAFAAWQADISLPSRVELHARALAVLAPIIEGAGFPRQKDAQWSRDAETAEFHRTGAGFTQIVRVVAFDEVDKKGRQYGLSLQLEAFLPTLDKLIYTEGRIDLPHRTSAATPAARILMPVLATGWTGPIVRFHRWHGFGVEGAADIEPLLHWLAGRTAGFALPLLRRIESPAALAELFDVVPLSGSPLFLSYVDFALPLSFELARHPRLESVLDEIERSLPTVPESWPEFCPAMQALIGRIRAREVVRRAAYAKTRRGFWGRLFGSD